MNSALAKHNWLNHLNSPGSGRGDPLGFDAGDSNLYRYVKNGPTNATDPSGLEPIWEITNPLFPALPADKIGGGKVNVKGGPNGVIRVQNGVQARLVDYDANDLAVLPEYRKNAVAIGYYGTQSDKVRVIQFMWAEMIITKNAQRGRLKTNVWFRNASGKKVFLTGDLKNLKYIVDAPSALAPDYEARDYFDRGPSVRTYASVAIIDRPEPDKTVLKYVKHFGSNQKTFWKGVTKAELSFHFYTFFVVNGKVFYNIAWKSSSQWDSQTNRSTDPIISVLRGSPKGNPSLSMWKTLDKEYPDQNILKR
jgi:hypothetical protein